VSAEDFFHTDKLPLGSFSMVDQLVCVSHRREKMDQQTYIVTFEGASPAYAQRYAEELQNALLDAAPDITVQRRRANPLTQDFGATLILILGTPAVVAVVKAVRDWLTLRNHASLTWKTADGELVVQNITSKNAAELAQFLVGKQ
jgi:hypothetical protein